MAKKKISWKRKLAWSLAVASTAFVLYVTWAVKAVSAASEGRIYTVAAEIPQRRVALVLGTAPKLKDGRNNVYFTRRIVAAAQLYKAGRVEKILVSGDNSRIGYDEPTAMRDALIARGIPAENVVADFAGFRTLDSIVRAHKVFGLEELIVVTDDFHLPRALYLAQHEGVDAIGFQTDLAGSLSNKMWLRETGARALLFLDLFVLNRQPKFLGKRETI